LGKRMKIAVAMAASVLLVLLGAYLASPYLAVIGLVNAVRAGDKDGLEDRVDFPAVREHLKAQITTGLIAKFQRDPELQANPFAGLGLALIPMMADKAVDALVTPEGLIHLLDQGQAAARKPVFGLPRDAGYVTLDRFRVGAPAGQDKTKTIELILRRQGLFNWTLTRIALPKNFLETEASPAEAASAPSDVPAAAAEDIVASDAPVAEPAQAPIVDDLTGAPPPVAGLVARWREENGRCRGGSGDDPATGQACDDREITGGKIDALGWCYGQGAEYGYQARWARCEGR
jgi:hypothetical protein